MSAKKLLPEQMDSVLQIEWGNFTRSEAVEKHLETKTKKILSRAKGATHLIVSLSTEISGPKRSNDLVKVHFELRLPKHQDLFCHSEGHNLYEAIAECTQHMLRQVQDRKTLRIQKRAEFIDISDLINI
jgi:ribosome-associated translation inhibitor RaiA